MSLLWSSTNLRAKDLKVLIKQSAHADNAEFEHRLSPLVSLGILSLVPHRGVQYVHMHPGFRYSLRMALANGGKSNAFGVSYVPSEEERLDDPQQQQSPPPTVEELVEYGNSTWEAMLKYMVSSRLDAFGTGAGAGAGEDRPEREVLDLLVESGLMAETRTNSRSGGRSSSALQISSKGFQFLLEDRAAQIWQVLMFFVAEKTGYSARALSPAQSAILDDLEAYGLIYRRYNNHSPQKDARDDDDDRGGGKRQNQQQRHDEFFPTGLATTLCSGGGGSAASAVGAAGEGLGSQQDGDKGFLILETNYKVYAYTSNELQIAILNLFVDIRVRYPNLIVGKLERDTVKRAMEEGITASQIISYLSTHAHPQMQKNNPLLPITVVDQLHLWDKERNRLDTNEGVLFKLRQKHLYEDAVSHAKTLGSLIYHAESNRPSQGFVGNVFVATFAAGPMRDYLNTRRAEHEAY
ncbi:hypothetical protein QFC21_004118 [Naganishia friedmannii]|uniref:Uncharacterized protein n=1 Tax=Naganishia friedmannii TaxID=89922 RepID=A0ACC2VJB2_9TREE|nr:hypothetical protein QFC21_004118 [Naganishia friedmannii]